MPPRERQNWREDKISRKGTKNDDENGQHGGENDENDEHGGEDDFDEVKLEDGGGGGDDDQDHDGGGDGVLCLQKTSLQARVVII